MITVSLENLHKSKHEKKKIGDSLEKKEFVEW